MMLFVGPSRRVGGIDKGVVTSTSGSILLLYRHVLGVTEENVKSCHSSLSSD